MSKRTYDRITDIPQVFPIEHYMLPHDLNKIYDRVIVGIDSGTTHCAFVSANAVRTNQRYTDFEITSIHYFEDEVSNFIYTDDKIFFLSEQYWNIYAIQNVCWVCFERLALDKIKDSPTLSAVISAQRATDAITFVARSLGHQYSPLPPTKIKYTVTGDGRASKEKVQECIYKLTDEKYPILLENNHVADAAAISFTKFVDLLKYDHQVLESPVPQKFIDALPWIDWDK